MRHERLNRLGLISAALAAVAATATLLSQKIAPDITVPIADSTLMLKFILLFVFIAFGLIAVISGLVGLMNSHEAHGKMRKPNNIH